MSSQVKEGRDIREVSDLDSKKIAKTGGQAGTISVYWEYSCHFAPSDSFVKGKEGQD